MNMIELVQYAEQDEQAKSVYISKEAIVALEPHQEGTLLTISTGRAYLVVESVTEILNAPTL